MLQSFPKKYKFIEPGREISKKGVGRLIGNAVPVKLGEVIGKSIIEHVSLFSEELDTKNAGKNTEISKHDKINTSEYRYAIPEIGQLVEVRRRQWLVSDIQGFNIFIWNKHKQRTASCDPGIFG